MATQGIQRQFVAKGIAAVEAADGRRFFVDELTYGQKGEVEEIIPGEGPWKVDSNQQLSSLLELGALFWATTNWATSRAMQLPGRNSM